MGQIPDDFKGFFFTEFRCIVIDIAILPDNSVNATELSESRRFVETLFHSIFSQVIGKKTGMLEQPAIHVNHIDRSVGCIVQINRPESFISSGQEFFFFVSESGFGCDFTRGVIHTFQPLDQVSGWFSDESIAPVFLTKLVTSVDNGPSGCRTTFESTIFANYNIGSITPVHTGRMCRPHGFTDGNILIYTFFEVKIRMAITVTVGGKVCGKCSRVMGRVKTPPVILSNAPLMKLFKRSCFPLAIIKTEALYTAV